MPTRSSNQAKICNEIKEKINLISYIERDTGHQFKSEGGNYCIPCPFCDSPKGFKIKKSKPELFQCFACNRAGSVIDYVLARRGISQTDAIKTLAKELGTTPEPKENPQTERNAVDDSKARQGRAQYIWKQVQPTDSNTAAQILTARLFPSCLHTHAKDILTKLTRLNAYMPKDGSGQETWLLIPQSYNGSVTGINRIFLEKDGQHDGLTPYHSKLDLGEKAGTLLNGYGENSHRCIVVESFFNALALSACGYSVLSIYSKSNIKTLEKWLPKLIQDGYTVSLWLDYDATADQKKLCKKYNIAGIYFLDTVTKTNWDVCDEMERQKELFPSICAVYVESATKGEQEEKPVVVDPVEKESGGGGASIPCLPEPTEKHDQPKPESAAKVVERFILDNLVRRLENPVDKTIFMVLGGTGAGKTMVCLGACARLAAMEAHFKQTKGQMDACTKLAKMNLPSLFLCSTVQEAMEKFGDLEKIMVEHGASPKDAALIISGSESGKEDDAKDDSEENIAAIKACNAKIIITTYGYLGRKGETATGYQIGHEMIEGRYVFCDEVQILYEKMKVSYPLLARYLLHRLSTKNEGQYDRVVQCPKASHKGDCLKCIIAALRHEDKKNHVREFYYKFPEQSFAVHASKKELGIMSWDDVLDQSKYNQSYGTLFMQYLAFTANFNIPEDADAKSHSDFLHHLSQTFINPHLRMQLPIDKATQTPVSPDAIGRIQEADIKKLQLPCQACGIPLLCGIDILALLQLMGNKVSYTNKAGIHKTKEYKGAHAIVMTSATIPMGFVEAVQKVAAVKGWQIEKKELAVVPFRFDVTLLKTSTRLGITRTTKTVTELAKKTGKKMFVVTHKKSDSDDLVTQLRKSIPKKVVYFYKDAYDYEHYQQAIENALHQILLTYTRSAITRAANFPDFNFMMADCSMFLPFAAIGEIHPNMTADERRKALFDDIAQQLTQIIGRILRTQLPRIPGQTVDDPRKIVVLLHGLPDGLQDFALDAKLLHASREYRETFVSKNAKKFEQSIVDSIAACLDGKEPVDYDQIEKEELAKKSKIDMSRTERAKIDAMTDTEKAESDHRKEAEKYKKTLERLIEQGKELQVRGVSEWREISRALHINRYGHLEDILRQELGF
jgi:DNA primase